MKFTLEIITPERVAFSEEVSAVFVPTINGTIGVLPKHVPLFTSLTEGEIKVVTDKKELFLAIGGGFMEVTKDRVSILVSRAVHADELNEEDIKKARKQAADLLTHKGEFKDIAAAQAVLRRSMIEMRVLDKIKNRKRMVS